MTTTTRQMCQLCGGYFLRLSMHVKAIHKENITDLVAKGLWRNERNPEE